MLWFILCVLYYFIIVYNTKKKENWKPLPNFNVPKHWRPEPPKYFTWLGNKIVKKEACNGHDDGYVPATGKELYDYTIEHDAQNSTWAYVTKPIHWVTNSSQSFYFECLDGRANRLYRCQKGMIFDKNNCHLIDSCIFENDGFCYPHPSDPTRYYECLHGESTVKKCTKGQLFLNDGCINAPPCFFAGNNEKIQIDEHSYYECVQKMHYEHRCKSNEIFFDNECIDNRCRQESNGRVIISKTFKGLTFNVGYVQCKDYKFESEFICPQEIWDPPETTVADLRFLRYTVLNPDNFICEAPNFCKNVFGDGVTVSGYSWQKHAPLGSFSRLRDELHGYTCVNGKLKLVDVDPGYKLENTERVSLCGQDNLVPVNSVRQYFDCATKTVHDCPTNQYFSITDKKCIDELINGHSINGLRVFNLDNLERHWMFGRDYLNKSNHVVCEDDEIRIRNYNVCSDEECEIYPFLGQIKGMILTRNNYACHSFTGKIKKHELQRNEPYKLDYWRQKYSAKIEPCISGSKVQTKFPVLNATLYATCKEDQPFVFCPSYITEGIQKHNNVWMCIPKSMPPQPVKKAKIFPSNVLFIEFPKHKTPYTIDNKSYISTSNTISFSRTGKKTKSVIESEFPFTVHEYSQVSNPPTHYIENGTANSFSTYSYYLPNNGGTSLEIEMEKHNVSESVRDIIPESYLIPENVHEQ